MLRQFVLRVSNKGLGGHFSEDQRKLTRTPFGDVVTFIEETLLTSTDQIPTFRLSDLIKLYNSHLSEIRLTLETKIYITRFRSRLLTQLEKFSGYDVRWKLCWCSIKIFKWLLLQLQRGNMMMVVKFLLRKLILPVGM